MARAPWDRMTGNFYGDLLRMGACFDPGTLAIAATVAAGVGTAVQVVGAIQQSSAASKADKYNAQVAAQNSQISTDQAKLQLQQQQRTAQLAFGTTKAAYGASGVTSDGSPMDVLQDSFTQSELDANTIIYNGKVRSAGYTNQANLDTASAANARTAGYTDAASKALLGSVKTYQAYDSVGTSSPAPTTGPGLGGLY